MARRRVIPYNGSERRTAKRWPFWAVASCSELNTMDPGLTSGYSNNSFFASAVNISEEGMLLESFEKIKPGSLLTIKIEPSEDRGEHYKFIGRVMHNEKMVQSGLQGVGVKFLQKPKNMERLLN